MFDPRYSRYYGDYGCCWGYKGYKGYRGYGDYGGYGYSPYYNTIYNNPYYGSNPYPYYLNPFFY